jgi:hypothetical protein
MKTKKPKNEPAFPSPHFECDEGMTLRDYFAAKAMQGLLAKMIYAPSDIVNYTEQAYLIADGMLKQREL